MNALPPLSGLTRGNAERLVSRVPAAVERNARRQLFKLFPHEGRYRRALYPKHQEFFRVTKDYRDIGMMAANRVGKSTSAGYATSCFLTGWYPDWWEGRVFDPRFPIIAWACAKTNEKVKEVVQFKLLGDVVDLGGHKTVSGTGLIPGEWLGRVTWRHGVSDVVETARVRHIPTGRWSTLVFKSYEQGRGAYEGTNIKSIWLDEEPPQDIHNECLLRTTATTGNYDDNGVLMSTFTPLDGVSDVARMYMPGQSD